MTAPNEIWTADFKGHFKTGDGFYNRERPHEALGQRTPASVYHPSERAYPSRLPKMEYPGYFEVRRVSRNGGGPVEFEMGLRQSRPGRRVRRVRGG